MSITNFDLEVICPVSKMECCIGYNDQKLTPKNWNSSAKDYTNPSYQIHSTWPMDVRTSYIMNFSMNAKLMLCLNPWSNNYTDIWLKVQEYCPHQITKCSVIVPYQNFWLMNKRPNTVLANTCHFLKEEFTRV
jgi:hypothetical protein